ncbi:MAG: hypothetical protein ACLU9X_07810 [Alistipes shahii]
MKKSTPFVFVSVPADCEIPVENGMPKIYKKIALGDNDVVQRSFTLERTGKKERFTLLALADVQIGRDDEVVMLEKEVLPCWCPTYSSWTNRSTAFRWATWCGTTCLSTASTRSRSGRSAYPSSR